ncbi:MAG TPA: peptide-methionine (S)-S-oxide reductase MsrA [Alphaproteobacteria bacterium]|nr:peptide-methionine (S)-S-oxide reductase MsrA [Alphaproteobacteria bacterium]
MSENKEKKAIFAGGCFWCTETVFTGNVGVNKVTSGYIGGDTPNPTYKEVSTGTTGYYEAVEVIYNPDEITYNELLNLYWESIDPTDAGGQFADRGTPYFTAIFYTDEDQLKVATESRENVAQKLNTKIATRIIPAGTFYPAEEYHQQYSKKNPVHYNLYKNASGREKLLNSLWHNEK